MDRGTQPAKVVKVPGRLVGDLPDLVAEGGATPAPLGQTAPAELGQETGILLRQGS